MSKSLKMSYRTSGLTLARWIQIQRQAKRNRESAIDGVPEDKPTHADDANILQIEREEAVACPPIKHQEERGLPKTQDYGQESDSIYSPVKSQDRPREQNIPAYATLTHQPSISSRDSFRQNATPPIEQKTESLVGHYQSPRPNQPSDENEVVGYRKTLRVGMDEDWIEQRKKVSRQKEVDETVGFKKTMRLEEEKWHENGQAKPAEQPHGRIILDPINQETPRLQEAVHQSTQVVETSRSAEEAVLKRDTRRESQVIQVKERELNKRRSRDTIASAKKIAENVIEVQETKANPPVNLTKERSKEEYLEAVEKKPKKKKKKKKVKPEAAEETSTVAASAVYIKSSKNNETSEIPEKTIDEAKEKKVKRKKSDKNKKMSRSSDDTESLIKGVPKKSEPNQKKPSNEPSEEQANDNSFMKFLESKLDNDLNALTSGNSVDNANPDMQSKLDQILSPQFQRQMDAFLSGSSYDNNLMDNFNSLVK